MSVHATLSSLRRYSLILMGLTIILAACGGKGDGGSSTTTCAPATILLTDVTALYPTKGANKMGDGSNHGGHGGSDHGGHGGSSTTTCTPATTLLPDVTALFPISGANWNDYLTGDDWRVATGACIADAAVPCLHGGERRVVELTGKTACAGLTAADDLGVFEWICDDSVSPVRMISTGLAKGKSLSDLIDFTTPGFKTNKVTVYDNAVAWRSTPDSNTWWSNPVEINNTGGSLATASTIYLVTSNPAAAITLGANKVALVAEPSVTLTGPGTAASVISAASQDYLWIEGNINASADNYGVNLNARYSTLRQLTANNALQNGVFLNTASSNTLAGVNVNNNSNAGVLLSNSSGNRLRGMTASNNIFGVSLSSSSNNTLKDVTASNNSNSGVYLSSSSNNILTGVTTSNNITAGIFLYAASNNTLNSMTANNNIAYGVFLQANSNNNTFAGVTTSNNAYGVSLQTGSNNNALTNVTSSINAVNGVVLSTVSDNKFSGLLKVGNNGVTDCQVSGGTNPGLDSACVINGSSNATTIIGSSITLANSYVGKVSSDDVANISDDILGGAVASFPANPASFDWCQFDNPYRAWGLDGSDFPSASHRGRWASGAGRIWDWSLLAGDTVNKAVLSFPTGNNTQTHVWLGIPAITCNTMVAGSVWNATNSVCETTFLSNAVEILADGIGNDNGLCESTETCLYTPNIGSYQGSGLLVSAGAFTDGTLTSITLMEFTKNGE